MLNQVMDEQEKKVHSNQNSMIQNSDQVTPPLLLEPKVKSERKDGGILVEDQKSNILAIAKNNETEANCTFGIINNNSVHSRDVGADSYQRKSSFKSSQESTAKLALKKVSEKLTSNA